MNKRNIITTLAGLLAGASSYGEWTIVSTFDDAGALSAITDSTNIEGSNARSEIVNGKWAVFPGDLFEATSNLYAMLDLGTDLRAASIASGKPVTVYFEVVQPTVPDGQGGTRKAILDTVWGISNYPPSQVLETRYNSYNAMQRINAGNDSFEGRNGNAYEVVQQFGADVTYQIWLVIDFTINFYEAYIQGGQWTEQTRLGTAATEGFWGFRVNPAETDTAQYMLVALSRGNSVQGEKGIDPTYFDNVAIDSSGLNLTSPVGSAQSWAGFAVDGAGNVNTGGWMGFLNVSDSPWIWSYSLSSWMYIDESFVSSSGSWIYVLK
jgi:hypothetical protein